MDYPNFIRYKFSESIQIIIINNNEHEIAIKCNNKGKM